MIPGFNTEGVYCIKDYWDRSNYWCWNASYCWRSKLVGWSYEYYCCCC